MAQNYIDEIMNHYDFLRMKARRERDERVEKIYKSYPRLSQIKDTIRDAGIENTSMIFKYPEKKDFYLRRMKEQMDRLEAEKKAFIKANGIDEDFDQCRYQCPLCQDTGFVENKKCSCFQQQIIAYGYESSNMAELLKTQNFENFRFDYYDDTPQKGENSSPKEYIQRAYQEAKNFCEQFDKAKSLLFYGGTGLGKTFLSSCIAKEMIEQGKTVLYTRATKLFSMHDDYTFNREISEVTKDMIQKVYDCDLLIIDDLGTEFKTKSTVSFLFDIINERVPKNKKMILSTNLNPGELVEMYSQRFISRMFESFLILKFTGEDIRIKKN